MPTIWYGIGAVVGLVLLATSLRVLKAVSYTHLTLPTNREV